jgi:hypothetical protein
LLGERLDLSLGGKYLLRLNHHNRSAVERAGRVRDIPSNTSPRGLLCCQQAPLDPFPLMNLGSLTDASPYPLRLVRFAFHVSSALVDGPVLR